MGGVAPKTNVAKEVTKAKKVAVLPVQAKKSSTVSGTSKLPVKTKLTELKTTTSKQKKAVSQSTTMVLTKSPEPKNARVKITNNVVPKTHGNARASKPTVRAETKKVTPALPSNSVLPKPAIRSPFRFPMVLPKVSLALVTRVVGIFFVATGSVLTLLNLPALTFTPTPASLTDGLTNTTTSGTPNTTETSGSIDTTPDVQVSVNGTSPFSGTVPITITVPRATNVKLILDNRTTNQLMTLGMATQIDDMTWTYAWHTTSHEDGSYRIRVLIQNPYGAYESNESTTYEVRNVLETIENTPDTQTSSSTTSNPDDTTTEPSTPPTQTQLPEIDFSVQTVGSTTGGFIFRTVTEGARQVSIYATNAKTGTRYYIGDGTLVEEEWVKTWNAKNVPSGTYYFIARVTYDGFTLESERKTKTIENQVVTTMQASTTPTTTAPVQDNLVKPSMTLTIAEGDDLSGFAHLSVSTSPVNWVELYAVPYKTLTSRFLGLATKQSDTSWTYTWDTTQTPNGTYEVYPRVKTAFGSSEGTRTYVRVNNPIMTTYTEEEEATIKSLTSVTDSLTTITEDVAEAEGQSNTQAEEPRVVFIESIDSFVERIESTDESMREDVQDVLKTYREKLNVLLGELANARRTDDESKVLALRSDIEQLKQDVIASLPGRIDAKDLIDQINTYLSQITFQLEETTLNNEDMLKKRIGDAVFTDTDKDGVSDYDEVHLYMTNPFAADTDGDGAIDSSEISKGYNPLDASEEALVTYESPKESGIVREDMLAIDSFMSLSRDSLDEPLRAIIAGTALPNSFVTLYFYSSPVIVTVKAGSDGTWSYILDKELENGTHEVYVGLTDNTGTIVAKSNPFTFTKTAEAYTATDVATASRSAEESQPQILDTRIMLLIASLLIVSLGVILLLIGAHASKSQPKTDMVPQPV